MAKRRILEPLALIQEESIRKRGREISKESFESKIWEIEIGVICNASKKATTTAYNI